LSCLPSLVSNPGMTSDEALALARTGDLEAVGGDLDGLADAVTALSAAGQAAQALELTARTWRLWSANGDYRRGHSITAGALAITGAADVPVWYVRALYADGALAFRLGDLRRSLASNEAALAAARDGGDVDGECDALTGLARVALREGRYDHVVRLAREARARAHAAGSAEAEAGPLHLEAAGTRLRGDYVGARELYLESLNLNRSRGNQSWVAMEQHNLGWIELHLGNVEAAAEYFRARDATSQGDAYGDAWKEMNWAAVAAVKGDTVEADARFKTAGNALSSLGIALDPDDQFEYDWLAALLARSSGDR
jgi:tetratricopeptide (TPR) repeat protein